MVLRHGVGARNETQVICKGSKGSQPLRHFSSPSREPFWDYNCPFQSAFALLGLSLFTWFFALLALLRWVKWTERLPPGSETHHRGSLPGSHRSLEAQASDSIISCPQLWPEEHFVRQEMWILPPKADDMDPRSKKRERFQSHPGPQVTWETN